MSMVRLQRWVKNMKEYSHKGSSDDLLSYIKEYDMRKGQISIKGQKSTSEEFHDKTKQHVKLIEDFPIHLYPPRGCQTFDIRRAVTLTNPTVSGNLIDFIIPEMVVGFWRSYCLFTNTQAGTNSLFDIRINGNTAFKYHGDSLSSFDKNLALGVDLTSEIDALQELQAGDRITIDCTISAPPPIGIPATIAARAKGWLITDRIELRGRSS
jgi:hypothetical protein